MAFWLDSAAPSGPRNERYPAPYAEDIRRMHVLRLRACLALCAPLTFLGLLAFFSALLRLASNAVALDNVPTAMLMLLPSVLLLFALDSFGMSLSLAGAAGHGRESYANIATPDSLRPTRGAAFLWTAAAALAAAAFTAPLPWPRGLWPFTPAIPGLNLGEPWQAALALICLALAVLTGRWARAWTRKARAGWREESKRRTRRADLLARGEHAVGTVVQTAFNGVDYVDGSYKGSKSLFLVELAYPAGGQTRTVKFVYPEFACWAPQPGNEFDVWFDPAAPEAPGSTLLQRRLPGQEKPADPSRYRVKFIGSDRGEFLGWSGTAPKWYYAAPGDIARSALWHLLGQVCAVLLWLLSIPLWFRALPMAPVWTLAPLLAHLALGAFSLWGWYMRLRKPQQPPQIGAWARAAGYANLPLVFLTFPLTHAWALVEAESAVRPVHMFAHPFFLWLAVALIAWLFAWKFSKLPEVSEEFWARLLRLRAAKPLSAEEVYEQMHGAAATS
jgi:hypothetical protein